MGQTGGGGSCADVGTLRRAEGLRPAPRRTIREENIGCFRLPARRGDRGGLDARSPGRGPVLLALGAVVLALCIAPGPARGSSLLAEEEGVVSSVNWEDGTLLVENGEEFRVIVVDLAVPILDLRGRALSLRDVEPGDSVSFRVEQWGGMWIATSLRVITVGRRPHDRDREQAGDCDSPEP